MWKSFIEFVAKLLENFRVRNVKVFTALAALTYALLGASVFALSDSAAEYFPFLLKEGVRYFIEWVQWITIALGILVSYRGTHELPEVPTKPRVDTPEV